MEAVSSTTIRGSPQPLITAMGRSLTTFLLMPAAWQVSTTYDMLDGEILIVIAGRIAHRHFAPKGEVVVNR